MHNPKILVNTAANIIGTAWPSFLAIVFVPLYIKFIGIEAYGLLSFFQIIQVFVGLLDAGLRTSSGREIARLNADPDSRQIMCDFTHTMEIIYWGIAATISLILPLFIPLLVKYWVNLKQVPQSTAIFALVFLAFSFSFRLVASFYAGILGGLQHMVIINSISVIYGTVRSVGVFLALYFISPTIRTFVIWDMFSNMLFLLTLFLFTWRILSNKLLKAKINFNYLKKTWKYSAGISSITIVTTILTQSDKILLSKLLSLSSLGYYTLATTMAALCLYMISAFCGALFPSISQLIVQKDDKKIVSLYHYASQISTFLLLPFTSVLIFFPKEILLLWTNNPTIVINCSNILMLFTIGTLFNGFVNVPYYFMLAIGWLKLAFYQNLISLFILIPLLYFFVINYGVIGATFTWILLNGGAFIITMQIFHHKILRQEKWKWYLFDVLLPTLSVYLIAFMIKQLVTFPHGRIFGIIVLAGVFLSIAVVSLLTTSASRSLVKTMMIKIRTV